MTTTATPRQWHRLIQDAEEFRARYSWGLAGVWGAINAEDYTAARTAMDERLADAAEGIIPRRRHPVPSEVRDQLLAAYRAMTGAGIDPGAATASEFAEWFWCEEKTDKFDVGCCDFPDREAMAYIVTALRCLCGVERDDALVLLRMAVEDIQSRMKVGLR